MIKILRHRFLIISVCCWSAALPKAFGETFDAFLLAESGSELLQALEQTETLQTLRTACSREIQRRVFPGSCMKSMELESLKISNSAHWEKAWKELSQSCAKTAGTLASLEHARYWFANPNLDGSCHKALIERIKDLEYIME